MHGVGSREKAGYMTSLCSLIHWENWFGGGVYWAQTFSTQSLPKLVQPLYRFSIFSFKQHTGVFIHNSKLGWRAVCYLCPLSEHWTLILVQTSIEQVARENVLLTNYKGPYFKSDKFSWDISGQTKVTFGLWPFSRMNLAIFEKDSYQKASCIPLTWLMCNL